MTETFTIDESITAQLFNNVYFTIARPQNCTAVMTENNTWHA